MLVENPPFETSFQWILYHLADWLLGPSLPFYLPFSFFISSLSLSNPFPVPIYISSYSSLENQTQKKIRYSSLDLSFNSVRKIRLGIYSFVLKTMLVKLDLGNFRLPSSFHFMFFFFGK